MAEGNALDEKNYLTPSLRNAKNTSIQILNQNSNWKSLESIESEKHENSKIDDIIEEN